MICRPQPRRPLTTGRSGIHQPSSTVEFYDGNRRGTGIRVHGGRVTWLRAPVWCGPSRLDCFARMLTDPRLLEDC